jgi:hypothetical protein
MLNISSTHDLRGSVEVDLCVLWMGWRGVPPETLHSSLPLETGLPAPMKVHSGESSLMAMPQRQETSSCDQELQTEQLGQTSQQIGI